MGDSRRKEILEQNIAPWARKGYWIQSQGQRMAQLIKPHRPSACLMVLLILLFWPAAIIYYMAARDKLVLIEVNDDLSVSTTEAKSSSDTALWVVITVAAVLGILVIVIWAAVVASI